MSGSYEDSSNYVSYVIDGRPLIDDTFYGFLDELTPSKVIKSGDLYLKVYQFRNGYSAMISPHVHPEIGNAMDICDLVYTKVIKQTDSNI